MSSDESRFIASHVGARFFDPEGNPVPKDFFAKQAARRNPTPVDVPKPRVPPVPPLVKLEYEGR